MWEFSLNLWTLWFVVSNNEQSVGLCIAVASNQLASRTSLTIVGHNSDCSLGVLFNWHLAKGECCQSVNNASYTLEWAWQHSLKTINSLKIKVVTLMLCLWDWNCELQTLKKEVDQAHSSLNKKLTCFLIFILDNITTHS